LTSAAEFVALLDTSWPLRGRAPWPLFRRVANAYGEDGSRVVSNRDVPIFLNILYRVVRYFRPRLVVQTGTATGASSIAIGLGLLDNRSGGLITIDPEPPSYFGVAQPVDIARAAVARAGLSRVVRFDRGYSTVALDIGRMQLPSGPSWRLPAVMASAPADLVVVDGDHTPLGAHLDLAYGGRALAPDGPSLIVCHDYRSIRAVRAAFDAWTDLAHPRFVHIVESPCGIAIAQV